MKKIAMFVTLALVCISAYAATLEQIASTPKGAECNAMLVEYYSQARTTSDYVQKFDPSPASWDEVLAYYQLILKNVERNENTEADLVFIKTQLMKMVW